MQTDTKENMAKILIIKNIHPRSVSEGIKTMRHPANRTPNGDIQLIATENVE